MEAFPVCFYVETFNIDEGFIYVLVQFEKIEKIGNKLYLTDKFGNSYSKKELMLANLDKKYLINKIFKITPKSL